LKEAQDWYWNELRSLLGASGAPSNDDLAAYVLNCKLPLPEDISWYIAARLTSINRKNPPHAPPADTTALRARTARATDAMVMFTALRAALQRRGKDDPEGMARELTAEMLGVSLGLLNRDILNEKGDQALLSDEERARIAAWRADTEGVDAGDSNDAWQLQPMTRLIAFPVKGEEDLQFQRFFRVPLDAAHKLVSVEKKKKARKRKDTRTKKALAASKKQAAAAAPKPKKKIHSGAHITEAIRRSHGE